MSGVISTFTTDDTVLTNKYALDYADFKNVNSLVSKAYVDYVFADADDLAKELEGFTGNRSEILAQFDTIDEISKKLIEMGSTGDGGSTIYQIADALAFEIQQTKNAITGFTGSNGVLGEKNRAIASETALSTKLGGFGTALANAINNEIALRKAGDTGINNNILQGIADRISAINAEVVLRKAGDTGVVNKINAYKAINDPKVANINYRTTALTGLSSGQGWTDVGVTSLNLKNVKNVAFSDFPNGKNTLLDATSQLANAASQGYRVAFAGCGYTLAVGAPLDASGKGSVTVYSRGITGDSWGLQPESDTSALKLADSTLASGANLGSSLSLSQNGNTLVAGAPNQTGGGCVLVWTRSKNAWKKVQTLTATGTTVFGTSVSLSADGNKLLVGDPEDSTKSGKVYLAEWNGTTFGTPIALTQGAPTTAATKYGCAVAISGDGTSMVVGGSGYSSNMGDVWKVILSNSTGVWTATRLAYNSDSGAKFGSSVAISYDGKTIVAGGPDAMSGKGKVAVGDLSVGSAVNVVPSSLSTNDKFGTAVRVSYDGKAIVAGSPGANTGSGKVSIFVKNNSNNWVESSYAYSDIISGGSNTDVGGLGTSVSIGGNLIGGIAVGAPTDTVEKPRGVAIVQVPSEGGVTYNPNTNPYFLQLSDKFRITPNSTFSSLVFQKKNSTNGWDTLATLAKL